MSALIFDFERCWRLALFISDPLKLLLPLLLLLFKSIMLIQESIVILEGLVDCRRFFEVHESLVSHAKRLQLHYRVLTIGGYHLRVDIISLANLLSTALFTKEGGLIPLFFFAL